MLGVINEVPVANAVPPDGTLYQFIVPPEATAPRVTVPESQRVAAVVEIIVGVVFKDAVIAVLVAVVHPDAVAST